MTIAATNTNAPRIWAGCLACYNEGNLVGLWAQANEAKYVSPQDVHDASEVAYLADTPGHDELWVFDHENLPIPGECDLRAISPWAEAYAELDNDDLWPAYLVWCTDVAGDTTPPDTRMFLEAYRGTWNDREDFAREQFDALDVTAGMTEEQRRYFDVEAWSRDFFLDYHVCDAPGGGVYIFDARV